MDTTMNITHAGLRPRSDQARPVHPLHPSVVPRARFVAELPALRFTHMAWDTFRGTASPAKLTEFGAPMLIRSDTHDDEVEALIRPRSGEIVWIDAGHGQVTIEAAGEAPESARAAAARMRRALESPPPVAERVSIAFWMRGEFGDEVRHRQIEAQDFDAIASNYSARVRHALTRLIASRSPEQAG